MKLTEKVPERPQATRRQRGRAVPRRAVTDQKIASPPRSRVSRDLRGGTRHLALCNAPVPLLRERTPPEYPPVTCSSQTHLPATTSRQS